MIALFFCLYAGLGAAAAWGLAELGGFGPVLSILAGGLAASLLGQCHLFLAMRARLADLDGALRQAEGTLREVAEDTARIDERTVALESTVQEELTERRDALIQEMRQLETLIDKLTRSFDRKLETAGLDGAVAPQEDVVLRKVRDALQQGRVDLHLQPVVSLPQRRVCFYEGFTRLRDEEGSLILPAEFLDAARRAQLMGVVDNMMLYRSVEVVRRLAARDRRVGVFCNVSAHSLEDPHFFPVFLEHMQTNRDLAGALIFEITAEVFAKRSPATLQAMEQLSSLGFRFSLDHMSSLSFDLAGLQQAGVRFVKVNGGRLIEQLGDVRGPRPVSSISRPVSGTEVAAICSRYGVTLIAEKLEEEVSVVEILEYAISFGQGHIFGAPRPIKASLMEETAPPPELVARLTAHR